MYLDGKKVVSIEFLNIQTKDMDKGSHAKYVFQDIEKLKVDFDLGSDNLTLKDMSDADLTSLLVMLGKQRIQTKDFSKKDVKVKFEDVKVDVVIGYKENDKVEYFYTKGLKLETLFTKEDTVDSNELKLKSAVNVKERHVGSYEFKTMANLKQFLYNEEKVEGTKSFIAKVVE